MGRKVTVFCQKINRNPHFFILHDCQTKVHALIEAKEIWVEFVILLFVSTAPKLFTGEHVNLEIGLMVTLTKQEILSWSHKYDLEEDKYNTGLEPELGAKLRTNQELSKHDLIELVKWKFQGPLLHRREMILEQIEPIEDSFVRRTIKEALTDEDENRRIWKLEQIPGVGPSVASVILAFYDPENYGIFDTHAWREMFGEDPQDLFTVSSYFRRFLDRLRQESTQHKLNARVIEKAYFKKNKDESSHSLERASRSLTLHMH